MVLPGLRALVALRFGAFKKVKTVGDDSVCQESSLDLVRWPRFVHVSPLPHKSSCLPWLIFEAGLTVY